MDFRIFDKIMNRYPVMSFVFRCLLGILWGGGILVTAQGKDTTQTLQRSDSTVSPAKDTLYSLEYVYKCAGRNDSSLWRILDSIERREAALSSPSLPAYEIQLARAFVASRELNPHRAIRYLRPLLASEELHNDPENYLEAVALMCNEYMILNRTDQELKYTLQYLDLARRYGDSVRYASAYLYLVHVYQSQEDFDQAFSCLYQAQDILKRTQDPQALSYWLWSQEIHIDLYAAQQKYDQAIRLNRNLIARYRSLSAEERIQAQVADSAEMNFRQAQNFMSLACLYAYDGRQAAGRKAYDRACHLLERSPDVLSPQLNGLMFDYLKTAGRYSEALQCALRYQKETSSADSINRFHLEATRYLAEAYRLLEDYREAWACEHQVVILVDSLHRRANYEVAQELKTAYETARSEAQIHRQQLMIERHRNRVLLLSVGLIVAGVMLVWVGLSRRRIARKNRRLFDQLRQLKQMQEELKRVRPLSDVSVSRNESKENNLFNRLETLMTQQRVFLDPKLTREQVAAQLGTNKLYLSKAISEHCSMTFSEYLSQCRLEYARELLKTDHTTKIEAIAWMCGFSSVRTFYRHFQKAFQLTPSEYRALWMQQHSTPD